MNYNFPQELPVDVLYVSTGAAMQLEFLEHKITMQVYIDDSTERNYSLNLLQIMLICIKYIALSLLIFNLSIVFQVARADFVQIEKDLKRTTVHFFFILFFLCEIVSMYFYMIVFLFEIGFLCFLLSS